MTAPGRDETMAAGKRAGGAVMQKRDSFIMRLLRFLADVVRDVFMASFLVYLVLLVLDRVERGFASYFFNLTRIGREHV